VQEQRDEVGLRVDGWDDVASPVGEQVCPPEVPRLGVAGDEAVVLEDASSEEFLLFAGGFRHAVTVAGNLKTLLGPYYATGIPEPGLPAGLPVRVHRFTDGELYLEVAVYG